MPSAASTLASNSRSPPFILLTVDSDTCSASATLTCPTLESLVKISARFFLALSSPSKDDAGMDIHLSEEIAAACPSAAANPAPGIPRGEERGEEGERLADFHCRNEAVSAGTTRIDKATHRACAAVAR